MSHLQQLRSIPKNPNPTVLDLNNRVGARAALDEFDDSEATVTAVGEMLDRMQTQIEEQAAQIAGYQKEVRDLTMHKEAAYGEMTRAETAMRAERERANRAEQMCQHLTTAEREAQEKLKRLMAAVQTNFARAKTMLVASR